MAILLPTVCVAQATDISLELLRSKGIKALILDADNTLSGHGSQQPFEGAVEWTQAMMRGGVRLMIVSNNFKKRVEPFARRFGLSYVSMAMKPFPVGYIRAVNAMGVRREETAAVGDQVFTDILGANLSGIRSILVVPQGKESVMRFGWRRALEKPVREKAKRLGLWEERKEGTKQ